MIPSCRVRISGTGSFVPERVVTNDELAATVETSSEWIERRLGIHERRVVSKDQASSDLGSGAAHAALESAGLQPNDIDLVLVATSTPDRKAPSTACLVKQKVGMSNHAPAFDIAAVCSGFVYALATASHMIESGAYRRALVVGVDTFSKITDWKRRDCVFFGDAGGAVVLEASDYPGALFKSRLYADSVNTDAFTVFPEDRHFTMDSKAVFDVGTQVLPRAINTILADAAVEMDEIKYIIPHQPSIELLHKTCEILKIPTSKLKTNMRSYANTSGATVPLLLDETVRANELEVDDLVVFAAVGSGWTWGAAIYRWH